MDGIGLAGMAADSAHIYRNGRFLRIARIQVDHDENHIAGGWIGLARICRCTPLGTSGIDLVCEELPPDAANPALAPSE